MNKLRTALTGFSVGWGILLLIVLLSSGAGLKNAVIKSSSNVGLNEQAVSLYFSRTTIPYNGLPRGYRPNYSFNDCEQIVKALPEIKRFAPCVDIYSTISANNRSSSGVVLGTNSLFNEIKELQFFSSEGHFFNQVDMRENNKVIILPQGVAKNLFGDVKKVVGKEVRLESISYRVIGVYKTGSSSYNNPCYIPITTFSMLYPYQAQYGIYKLMLLGPKILDDKDEEAFRQRFVKICASMKGFSPDDTRAVWLNSNGSQLRSMNKLFNGINYLLWIIGLSTLTIGLVGVINIMQIAVTERKREIGIRKALGAKSGDIISSILLESVFVTLISGLIGLVLGVGLMALLSQIMETTGLGTKVIDGRTAYIFYKPIIDLRTSILALTTMIVGGLIAGYLPARKAVRVPTVEAMRK